MQGIDSLVSGLGWTPFLGLALVAALLARGIFHLYCAYMVSRYRRLTFSDPVIAEMVRAQAPPPYAVYGFMWVMAGLFVAGAILWLQIGRF